ncbi:MAG TPA: hypothetical protein VNL77_08165, partial [Roseiflexaceae bacterium]|nr:hypothetical protein [Roseiflexaceae bacterium]
MIQLLLTKPEGASQEGGVPGGASSAPANTLAPLPPLPLRHARGSTHPTLLARALRPEGTLARVCAALADTPGADDPDALLEAGVSLLLRALFLRCAAGRGLLPGAEESLAPGRLAWDGLRELCCAVARGEAAPGAASPGGLFDDDAHPLLRAARPDERLLAGALRELSEAPDGAPVDFGALPVRLLGTLQEEASGRRLVRRGGRLLL